MSVPKLRFKEFDENWNVEVLGNIVQIKSGYSPSKYELHENGEIPFLKVEELNNSNKYQEYSRFYTETCADVIPKKSVIFPKRGAAILNNKVRILKVDSLLDSNLMALIPQNTLDAEYLYYLINKVELYRIADTSTIPQINNKHIEPYEIHLPSKAEQTKIASFLSAVDEKISQLTQKHELLSQYKQGMMQKLFSQQIRFKADDGSEFGEWEDKPLNEIASKRSGKNKDGSISEVLTNSATQGIIKQGDYFEREIVTESNLNGYYIVNLDDFVYNPRISVHAPVGPIKRNKKCLGVMSPLYTVFTVVEGNLAYLEYFFDSNFWHDYVKGVANSGARHDRMNITNKDFFDMPILYPCLEEQTKIANFLSTIDQKIEVVAQQIEQAKQWKKGLLQQMFV
ncbi:restriction endonuclease subunit S [Acinetobacter indicus]|nr:restriction endonuclease subunit S [Acinetobacter indicus]QIC77736.1 restriction endonuclease subunit S [Acinetobacter indicus]